MLSVSQYNCHSSIFGERERFSILVTLRSSTIMDLPYLYIIRYYTYKLCPWTQEVLPKELHDEPDEPDEPDDQPVPTEQRDEYVMDSVVTGGDQMPPAEILQKFFGHILEGNAGDLGDILRFLRDDGGIFS